MKKMSVIIAAVLLAVQPVAFAADITKIASGGLLTGLGAFLITDAIDDRDEEVASCAFANPGTTCSESAFSAAPVKSIAGVLGSTFGVYLIVSGFSDEEGESFIGNKWYDGMSFHTDTGKLGLQKKWTF